MIDTGLPDLSRRIGEVLSLDPAARALEFDRVWHPWGELRATADEVAAHIAPGTRVGLMLRNRPAPVGCAA